MGTGTSRGGELPGACPHAPSPGPYPVRDWGDWGQAQAQTTQRSLFQPTVTSCRVPVPIWSRRDVRCRRMSGACPLLPRETRRLPHAEPSVVVRVAFGPIPVPGLFLGTGTIAGASAFRSRVAPLKTNHRAVGYYRPTKATHQLFFWEGDSIGGAGTKAADLADANANGRCKERRSLPPRQPPDAQAGGSGPWRIAGAVAMDAEGLPQKHILPTLGSRSAVGGSLEF